MKNLAIFASALILSGCAATKPAIEWISVKNIDDFTDVKSCKVTVGSLYTRSNVYTEVGKFYPFIEKVNGDLLIGLQSGGQFKIPVGNVQLRIDSNEAWSISTSETPVELLSSAQPFQQEYLNTLPEEQRKIVTSSYDSAMKVTTQAMSPFTAATGEKAKQIVEEMLKGTILKYRTIGLNQAASTIGEHKLDQSFITALADCGIKL